MSETVTFLCPKYHNYSVVYKPDTPIQYLHEDGKHYTRFTSPEYIKFHNHRYETSDPEKVKFLRNLPQTTGTPTVRKIIMEKVPPSPQRVAVMNYLNQFGDQAYAHVANLITQQQRVSDPLTHTQAVQNKIGGMASGTNV